MGGEFSLDTIPDEILIQIIGQLDSHRLVSIAPLICKRVSKVCIRSIEDKDQGSSFLYAGYNIKNLSDIIIPKELIINVLTHDSDSSFKPGGIYLMSIMYSAERLAHSVIHSINQFFNEFKTLHLESLKCLMLPKMPPYFIGTDAITCHQMERLYVEERVFPTPLDKLISVKKLHLILNPGVIYKIGLFPPNLERLAVSKSIEGGPTSSKLGLTLLTDACTKLKHM